MAHFMSRRAVLGPFRGAEVDRSARQRRRRGRGLAGLRGRVPLTEIMTLIGQASSE